MKVQTENEVKSTFDRKVFFGHLGLTFLIIGLCWGLCVILSINGLTVKNQPWIYLPWFLGGISPAIASYVVLKKAKRVQSFFDWLKHVFDFKHHFGAYLLAIVLPVIQAVLMCLISGCKRGLPLYYLPLMIVLMVFAGGLEEAGWRYVTFPELNKKFGFIVATFMTAVIWWLWHLPLFFIAGTSQFQKNFFVFGIMVLGMAFMLSAIRKLTDSVWLCVFCHSIVNSIGNFFHYDMYGSYLASSITTATLIAISLVLVFFVQRKQTKAKQLCTNEKV